MDDLTEVAVVQLEMALVERLMRVTKITRSYVQHMIMEAGLHPGQDELLNALTIERPMTVSNLAERLSVRPSTVSKMIERLQRDGFVERTLFAFDARLTGVVLTEKGAKTQCLVRSIWSQMEKDIFRGLSETELLAIGDSLALLDKVIASRLRRIR